MLLVCTPIKKMGLLTTLVLFSAMYALALDAPPIAAPQTVSTVTSTSSTSSAETGSCPVFLILEGNDQAQELLTRFRDRVLAKNDRGITYTRLYYLHSPEITLIVLTDEEIRDHARKILSDVLPIAAARLKKGEASLPQKILDDTDSLINQIARKASPQLRDALRMAKSDIIKKTIFEELALPITQ